jgi:hypothetical protein
MLLTLLLQSPVMHSATITSSDLTNVYIALAGTLIASGLAAYASFRASNKASATAREVVDLSTQTTRDVAALSAQVTREVATLTARNAQDLKDKDYKNDFYKRIIEKRLKAWEEAQELVGMLSTTRVSAKDGASLPGFFSNSSEFDKVISKIESTVSTHFWLGSDYTNYLWSMHNRLLVIRGECFFIDKRVVDGAYVIDNSLLLKAGKKYYTESNFMLDGLVKIIAKQIRELHDVESFLQETTLAGVDRNNGGYPNEWAWPWKRQSGYTITYKKA